MNRDSDKIVEYDTALAVDGREARCAVATQNVQHHRTAERSLRPATSHRVARLCLLRSLLALVGAAVWPSPWTLWHRTSETIQERAETYTTHSVWYGILGFNVQLDTV